LSALLVAPIVEGHGEFSAVRSLLQRIGYEIIGGSYIDVLRPIRRPKDVLLRRVDELHKAIDFAAVALQASLRSIPQQLILILLDADDDDPPCILGPKVQQLATSHRPDVDIATIIANVEYESWFVAAAPSLGQYIKLLETDVLPLKPEETRSGKGWIEKRYTQAKYSESVDQPKLTAKMDLRMARDNSPSFDKLCRELECRLR
jgi:hypothetical protein